MGSLYGFAYTKPALGFLRKLEKRQRKLIISKIDKLAENPTPTTATPVKSRSDDEETIYRVRAGKYRVLYVIRNPDIVILDIGHRKDIYR